MVFPAADDVNGTTGTAPTSQQTEAVEKMCLRTIWRIKKTLILILTPLVLLPIPFFYETKAGRCLYALLIMAVYWMTEVIPMAATALLPVVLMPWLGVMGSKQLCRNYLKDTNMLFLGGLMVAVAVEKWNLHKRIALRVLLLVGAQPRWLMFGFMITTAFLSMWISNTATTAMMVPIAHAVLTELDGNKERKSEEGSLNDDVGEELDTPIDTPAGEKHENGTVPLPHDQLDSKPEIMMVTVDPTITSQSRLVSNPSRESQKKKSQYEEMCKGLTLCVCYAANIGGTATLTGTGPNLVIKGQIDTLYGSDAGINFSSWFIYAFPNMIICLLLAWIWLQLLFLGPRELCGLNKKHHSKETAKAATDLIRREYQKLGIMSFAEIAVLVHFITLALLWLSREPEFIPGWAHFLLEEGYVTDAVVAITISALLFMFPSRLPNYLCLRRKSDTRYARPAPPLLDWDTVNRKLSWGVVLVLGGGFALADACKESGLSADISKLFSNLSDFPVWALVLILSTMTAIFTEVTSNVATATIFLPILAELATTLHVNPLYLMIPVTISTSFAFMLPVATPPNAIVFAYGHLKIKDMVKCGIVMNLVCIVVSQIAINTWGYAYFDLGTFPEWAYDGPLNGTLAVNATLDAVNMVAKNITL